MASCQTRRRKQRRGTQRGGVRSRPATKSRLSKIFKSRGNFTKRNFKKSLRPNMTKKELEAIEIPEIPNIVGENENASEKENLERLSSLRSVLKLVRKIYMKSNDEKISQIIVGFAESIANLMEEHGDLLHDLKDEYEELADADRAFDEPEEVVKEFVSLLGKIEKEYEDDDTNVDVVSDYSAFAYACVEKLQKVLNSFKKEVKAKEIVVPKEEKSFLVSLLSKLRLW